LHFFSLPNKNHAKISINTKKRLMPTCFKLKNIGGRASALHIRLLFWKHILFVGGAEAPLPKGRYPFLDLLIF